MCLKGTSWKLTCHYRSNLRRHHSFSQDDDKRPQYDNNDKDIPSFTSRFKCNVIWVDITNCHDIRIKLIRGSHNNGFENIFIGLQYVTSRILKDPMTIAMSEMECGMCI